MADPIDDSDVNDALRIARQPSNLVYDSDPIAPTYGEQARAAGAGLHDYLANLPSSIMQNLQRPQTVSPAALVRSRFTPQGQAEASRSVAAAAQAAAQPFVSAATAPGRAYRGEITPEQMFPEAMNFAGALTFGPMPTAGATEANVLRMGMGPTAISDATQLAKRELSPIGLYSHAAEVAQGLQPSGSASQLISALKNTQGVKPEELMNAGLIDAQGNVHPDWAGRGKITREDLAGHLQSSMPQVQETVLGLNRKPLSYEDWAKNTYPDVYEKMINARQNNDAETFVYLKQRLNTEWNAGIRNRQSNRTKYGEYTLPGGENYREVLLHLPPFGENADALNKISQQMYGKNYTDLMGDTSEFAKMRRDVKREYKNQFGSSGLDAEQSAMFRSYHWDQPNVLAHLRMADRIGPNGEKILHVEEIQSDWGQKGKKEGFQQDMTPEQIQERNDLSTKSRRQGYLSRDELMRLENLDRIAQQEKLGIPNAPYVTNTGSWTDLALKRALKEAAEGGYDKLVWTPGAEQAGRYDLSKQIDELAHWRDGDKIGLSASGPNGTVLDQHYVSEKELSNTVGKELAEKILKGEGSTDSITGYPKETGVKFISGEGLQVGGEGIKEYYDKIVPNQLKKIAKHYDPNAKVGYTDVMLPPSGKAGTNNPPMAAPGLDITPQMREAIMRGQKAFKRGGRTLGNNPIDNALRLALGGRAHFDDGGDVRGGDNPGGLSGDTGGYSGGSDNGFRDSSSSRNTDGGGSNFDGRMGRGQPETGDPIQHEVIGSRDFGSGIDVGGGNFTGHDMPTGLINYTTQRETTPYEGTPMTAAQDPSTAFGMAYPSLVGVQNTPAGTAALLANLGYESTQGGKAFQPNAISGSGYGLAQWTDPTRQAAFFNAMQPGTTANNPIAKMAILGTTTPGQQLGYALNEIQQKYPQVAREMATTKNIPSATENIMNKYESPATNESLDARIALANQIAKGTGMGSFAREALNQAPSGNSFAGISPSVSSAVRNAMGAGRGDVGILDSSLAKATALNTAGNFGAIVDEAALNSANTAPAASTTQAATEDTTPRIPVLSTEDPALIAAYNAKYGLSGPKNTMADMSLGQRVPNVTTNNPFVNTVQGLSNILTDAFTPNYKLGSEEYNKISQNPEPVQSTHEGRGGDRPQPYIPYIPPVATATAAPVTPMTPYVPQTPYVPPANVPYASLGANFIDPSVYQNPYLNQFLASGGKVHGNNAMGNAIRMAMGYKS